jgi:hypothetical protein
MQCGKKGVLGLRIQVSDAMDSFVEPCKRKRSCSVPVQRASISSVTRFSEFLLATDYKIVQLPCLP